VNEDWKIVSRSRVMGGVSLRRSVEQVSSKGMVGEGWTRLGCIGVGGDSARLHVGTTSHSKSRPEY